MVHHIVGQQISTKAQATIWQRMQDALGIVNAETILAAGVPKLQALGMTFRKAEYITDFAERVHSGAFDPEGIRQKSDEDAIRELSALKGIGVWTAEMILLFCMQRPNIFSYDDLAIQRGLRMVYHHRKIDRKLFEKYRRRFSPYCSVAACICGRSPAGHSGDEGLSAEKAKGEARHDVYAALRFPRWAVSCWQRMRRGSPACGSTGRNTSLVTCPPSTRSRTPLAPSRPGVGWMCNFTGGADFCRCCTPLAPHSAVAWDLLRVPYGQTVTLWPAGAAAGGAAEPSSHMSAQAVGGAVGHNAISIIIPCHRVGAPAAV